MSFKLIIQDIDNDKTIYKNKIHLDNIYYKCEDTGFLHKIKSMKIAANDSGSVNNKGKQIDFIMSLYIIPE